jgi:hypothetical protein
MYRVIITETLQKTVDVPEATSLMDALEVVKRDYNAERIVLSADDFHEVEFEPVIN